MFTSAITHWKNAMQQRAIWSGALWSAVFILAFAVITVIVGAGAIFSMFLHPGTPALSGLRHAFGALGLMGLFLVLAGPFLGAGLYGLYGQAVAGETITWTSFWALGARFYGRAWGMVLYTILWAIAVTMIGALAIDLLHVGFGTVVIILAVILSWPMFLRMLGALFVDARRWRDSVRVSLTGGGYGLLFGGGIVGLLASLILMVMGALLIHPLGIIGRLLYFAIDLFIAVATPVWYLALYAAISG